MSPEDKDGTSLTVSLYVSPLFDDAGQMSGCVAIVIDITQRKKAQEALLASEERYRDLFENAKDMIYTCDLEGKLTSVNKEMERITGYTREELLGMNMIQLVAPDYRPLVSTQSRNVRFSAK